MTGILSQPNMAPKIEFTGSENHDTSTSAGKVVSDQATDAAGNTPADLPAWPRPTS